MKRSAFTLIELVFAIVVIAIVIVSMPMMMRTNEDAIESNVVQEALFAASAKMIQVLSYPWDANATDQTNPTTYGKVINVFETNTTYYRKDTDGTLDVNSSYRVGHILQDNHRRFHDAQSGIPSGMSSLITNNPNPPTALNNVLATGVPFDNPATSKDTFSKGYKKNYTMDINVSYIPDTPSTSTYIFYNLNTRAYSTTPTNMKLITINIKDSSNNVLTSLSSYSANIGEFDFAKRRF